jgi:putative ABC transport system permease protein
MLTGKSVALSWHIVVHDRRRLLLSLCGIAFSVLIMFMELGFYNGLNDSQAVLPTLLRADLVVVDHERTNLLKNDRFNPLRLGMVQAAPEVVEVIPFYEGFTTLRNPQNRQIRKIYVLAYPPGSQALNVPGLAALEPLLLAPSTVVYDSRSRYIFGHVDTGMVVELETGLRHQVVGTVALGPNFGFDGYLLMSGGTWKALGNSDNVSLGLVRLRPGSLVADVQRRLQAQLPPDVVLLTPAQLRRREVEFTTRATPSGVIFGTGLAIGLVIGVVICYQILFNAIWQNLPQYATLKAMGFTNRHLVWVVMQQALILSVLGFLPGLLAGGLLYAAIEFRTSIIMDLTLGRASLIFSLTVLMCCLAGLLAVGKATRAAPADLY